MNCKISIIGAGSAVFSLNLIKDICINSNLKESTISLMDINEERLDAIYGLCSRYVEEMDSGLKVIKTLDRKECLEGADFVINVALDGGHQRLREGWEIAYKHGYRFGGSLHIVHDEAFWVNFHQINLMESIYLDILDVCPSAYYILVANPVQAGVTYLKRKYKDAKIVGMCHGYNGVNILSRAMGLNTEDVSYEISGVNHFIWMTKFFYKGQDAFPLLDYWIENDAIAYLNKQDKISCEEGLKAIDLYQTYGVFPIGDTCTPGGGSWGWWYHTDGQEKEYNEDPFTWYQNYFKFGLKEVEKIKAVVEDKTTKVSDAFSSVSSDEPMIPLIEALACDIEQKVIVNIQNSGGFVPGIPLDYEVEVAAMVSKKGIQPILSDGLPKVILSFLYRDRIAPVEMELKALETGNREFLISLIMMDPWTRSRDQANKFLDDILNMPINLKMKTYFTK